MTQSYAKTAISTLARNLADAIGLLLTDKSVGANFLSLKVNNVAVLTALPVMASFTTLSVGVNAVATPLSLTNLS